MFERLHHLRIAQVLQSLDADVLRAHHCYFGGGTAIALRHGEYRESVDIDFLVSDVGGWRELRALLTGPQGISSLVREGAEPLELQREVRADPYGIRVAVMAAGKAVKFEIVLEARMALAPPGRTDVICGVACLSPLDMAASKLLANSDRWMDDGVFSRDLIDLAMMKPDLPLLRAAVAKAQGAYGESVLRDLGRAIHRMKSRDGWLERCMDMMSMNVTKALVWQRIRALRRVLP
ncbi:nucleotidyl transferase AbiEii/AbiGii toxin family protein [Caenimonas aquaedulcis]|uniref:Nucleotidyl transferase AbiEii/AbiGii toxin family protein n=1 Tax=Caenimonas aquaedulcis TaxID=2793270 RepID=A0A931MGL9_9BURK|nr:nucleotidyl transferase AbiEii/AbiGii toxin family protein [Caenimonas aquaedulcis]MBG9388321.1 nucleotidyl transferase AbiEii/AbiGii toxin family protein [Caenimonas aquaedulcis]